MTNEQLALEAWKDAVGEPLTAVKLLRDSTDLSLREALKLIQKTAAQVGGLGGHSIIGEKGSRE